MAKEAPQVKAETPAKEMTLADLKGIKVKRAHLHQGFSIPGAGMETTIHSGRSGCKEIEILYTLHGVVIENKGERAIVPLANVIACHENDFKK